MVQERRESSRYPLDNLKIHLRVKRGFLSREWVEVKAIDFSRTGLGFKTDEIMATGDLVVISIHLHLDFGDVVIQEVEGVVRHIQKECSCFNYGVEFDFNSRRMKKENVQYGLARIEVLLERYRDILTKMHNASSPST
jgi:hypothetical protein